MREIFITDRPCFRRHSLRAGLVGDETRRGKGQGPHAKNPGYPRRARGLVHLAIILFASVCSGQTHNRPSITATPNPVPAGVGHGTTKITWDTGDNSAGAVFVSENGGPEKLFVTGPPGSENAPWVLAGTVYEFRLYEGMERKKLLAAVRVTRSEEPGSPPRVALPTIFLFSGILVLLSAGAYNLYERTRAKRDLID